MISIDDRHWQHLHPVIVESCIGTLEACGLAVLLQEPPPPLPEVSLRLSCPSGAPHEQEMVAVLGFTGAQMRGSVAVVAPLDLLRRTHPGSRPQKSDLELSDWAGELCNLLTGRVKARLLPRGITLVLSTPSCFIGEGVRNRGSTPAVRLLAGASWLTAFFDAEIAEDVDLTRPPAPPAPGDELLSEGDAMLF